MDDEAVLKALMKFRDDRLTFTKPLHVSQETREASRVAKETVCGLTSKFVYTVE